jgi:CheY-like chemotaxis protein
MTQEQPVDRRTILVVDDDMDVRDAYAQILDDSGYDAVSMRDGRTALDYLRTHAAPSAILLDVVMPNMDGFDFRQTQLKDPRWAAIPTLVVSADRLVAKRWIETGIAEFLTKPVNVDALLSSLEGAIRGRHDRVQTQAQAT